MEKQIRSSADIQKEIDDFNALIGNSSIPEDEKLIAKEELKSLDQEFKKAKAFEKKRKKAEKILAEAEQSINETKELIEKPALEKAEA